jgi:Response regulator containing CheY-like receiver domain and AraC-type DNA-binding domain
MNPTQLKNYLLTKQSIEKMENIERLIPSKKITVLDQEVYLFNETIDVHKQALIEESIFINQQPYDSHIPLHVHEFIELTYVFSGNCEIIINHKTFYLTQGEIVLVDKNTPHTVKEITKGNLILSITLKKDFLSPSFLSRFSSQSMISKLLIDSVMTNRQTNRYLLLNTGKNQRIIEILNHIICEYIDKRLYSEEIINSYFIIFFSELIRQNEIKPCYENNNNNENYSLGAFLQYIEDHYLSCTLRDMAKHFGFHPNYLSSLLKQGTGKSFKELLQLQKMSKASVYLLNSNLPISAIVEQVGY